MSNIYCDLEMWLRDHSRSLKLVPFESLCAVSYSSSMVALSGSLSFARLSNLYVEDREIFIPHLYLALPQGVTPSELREDVRLMLIKLE